MRAHVKKGYSNSDLVDLRFAKKHVPAFRAGVIRALGHASSYRLDVLGCETFSYRGQDLIVKKDRYGTPCITDMTPTSAKILARQYIRRAREWREEFSGQAKLVRAA